MVHIAQQSDIDQLFAAGMIGSDQSFDTNRDVTLVRRSSADPDVITGMLALRPMFYAHSFRLTTGSFNHAQDLFDAARRLATAAGYAGSLFHVRQDNAKMIRFILQQGAVMELDTQVFRYDILPTLSQESANGETRLDTVGGQASGGGEGSRQAQRTLHIAGSGQGK